MGFSGQHHTSAVPIVQKGLVGPTTNLDGCGKSCPNWDSILGPSRPKRVTVRTELSRPTQRKVSDLTSCLYIPTHARCIYNMKANSVVRLLLLLLAISIISTIYCRYRYIVHRLRYWCIHSHIPWTQNLVKITKRLGINHKSTKMYNTNVL